MKSLSVDQAQDHLGKLVDEGIEGQPVIIRGERKEAVLIAKQDWEAIQETVYLNSIPQMVESIQQAAQEPIEECIDLEDLEW